ncbi:Uncharacterised protein [uncultured archaeon]|nr:Uncharacterised protein [uncultured archaeon]
MRVLSFLSMAIFIGTFAVVYFTDFKDPLMFNPPFFHDANNFYLTEIVSAFFSFLCSMLFFGASGPIIAIIQASRYASILATSNSNLNLIATALLAIPNLLFVIAGTEYGGKYLDQMNGEDKTLNGRTELILGALAMVIVILLKVVIAG